MAHADATDNELAKKVLIDIANEERVHIGEFQRLIAILAPDEDGFLADGAAEVNEMAAGRGPEVTAAGASESPASNVPTIGSMRGQ
jgi:rubrerythrin